MTMTNLKTISVDKNIKASLQTPMPDYIRKTKPGKGNATYVTGQSVIDKLNATFGYGGWSWEIVKHWTESSVDKVTKVKYENGKKINLKPEEYIYESQLPVTHIIGRLTVYFERPDGTIHTVSKMAPGAQPVVDGQSNQENAYKGAHTDALKKAATMFGIALELYRDQNEQYFHDTVMYENPWTDEMLEKYKEEFKFLKEFKAQHNLVDEDMSNYMNNFSGGQYPTIDYLLPENIEAFVEYLKATMPSIPSTPTPVGVTPPPVPTGLPA